MLIGKVAGAVAAEIIHDTLVSDVRSTAGIVTAAGHSPPCVPAAVLSRTLCPIAPILKECELLTLRDAGGPGLAENFVFRRQPQIQGKTGLPRILDLDAFPGRNDRLQFFGEQFPNGLVQNFAKIGIPETAGIFPMLLVFVPRILLIQAILADEVDIALSVMSAEWRLRITIVDEVKTCER